MAEEINNGNDNAPLLRSIEEGNNGKGERPKGPWKGEYGKSIVYAGLDSIITSFSLIASIAAGHLSSVDVLVLGFANLAADGISMGLGDILSSGTERDIAAKERSITAWDCNNRQKLQEQELLRHYLSKGMSLNDARTVVSIFAKYKDILVDQKMATEKGIVTLEGTEKPWKNGLITFISFLAFGCAPILSFVILIPFTKNDTVKFIGACVLSTLALALLGIAKAKVAGQNYMRSAAITVLNGALAGASAYGIGWTLRNVTGLES